MGAYANRSFYAPLVAVLFLGGIGIDLLILCSALGFEPLTPFAGLIVSSPGLWMIFLFLCGAGLLLLSSLLYVSSLDPFRPERPRGLVYLNFFPLSLFIGVVLIVANHQTEELPALIVVATGLGLSFLLPLALVAGEAVAARVLWVLGRGYDRRGWRGAALFCFRNSLRCRPSIRETMRRCGLLLAETARHYETLEMLRSLEAVETSEDFEVLRALEKAYQAEGNSEESVRCLGRQADLRPDAPDIAQRLLRRYMELEKWDDAIGLLETGKLPLDLEMLLTFEHLYLRTGNIAQAMAKTRAIVELEPAPFARSIALYTELLRKTPENVELVIELGLLLQKTSVSDEMQRGAYMLEDALERDPKRLHLRRQLAGYYKKTLQHQRAISHYRRLIDDEDFSAETYLGYGDVLKAENRQEEACKVYRRMEEVLRDDWRAYAGEAKTLFALRRLEEADEALQSALKLCTEEGETRDELTHLGKRIARQREETHLQEMADEIERGGSDVQKRFAYVKQLMELDRGERAIAECDAILEDHEELEEEIMAVLEGGLPRVEHSFRLRDYLGDLYFRHERYDDVLSTFMQMAQRSLHPDNVVEEGCRKILSRRPDHLLSRMTLSEIYMRTENWEKALANFEPLMENPPEGEALAIKAQWTRAAFHGGKVSEALNMGLQILGDLEADAEFQALMIKILQKSRRHQKAFETLTGALERFPQDATLLAMKRSVASNTQHSRLQTLESLSDDEGLKAEEHFEKAELHHQFGDLQPAIIHFQRAAEDEEFHDLATAKLALCLCERRMFDLADETLDPIELTQENTARNPELKDLFYEVAGALQGEHFRKPAAKYFKRVFRIDAAFRDIVSRLETLG